MKMLIAYDGTLQAKDALRYGIGEAKKTGAKVAVLHVFDSSMFMDYEVSPNQMAFARSQSATLLDEARAIIRGESGGADVSVFTAEGDPEAMALEFALTEGVDFLVCTPRHRAIVGRYMAALEGKGRGDKCVIVYDGADRVAAACAKAA